MPKPFMLTETCITYSELAPTNPLICRSSPLEVFLRKGVLKICSRFIGEHPRRIVILMKLQSNFIEITLRLGFSPIDLLDVFGTPFPKNTWLLLSTCSKLQRYGENKGGQKLSVQHTFRSNFVLLNFKSRVTSIILVKV